MNIFVTTQMRAGSTWMCDLLSSLLGTKWIFWEKGGTIKPQKFLQTIRTTGSHKVIKMHWAHPNTICSQIPRRDKNNFVISITRDVGVVTSPTDPRSSTRIISAYLSKLLLIPN